jgi:hypothetical protein
VRQPAGDGVAGGALASTAPAPLVDLDVDDTAGQHRPVRFELLPGDLQAELVQAAERRQVGAGEGSVRHVEVFLASLELLRDLSYEPPQAMDRGRLGRRTKT